MGFIFRAMGCSSAWFSMLFRLGPITLSTGIGSAIFSQSYSFWSIYTYFTQIFAVFVLFTPIFCSFYAFGYFVDPPLRYLKHPSDETVFREVSSFICRGAHEIRNSGGGILFHDQKGGLKDVFVLKRRDHLYFFKRNEVFCETFQILEKGIVRCNWTTRGRKLGWDFLSQCKNFQQHPHLDVDFS